MPLLGYTYDFAQLLNTPEDWNKAQTSFNEIRAIVNALDGSNVQDNSLSQEKLIQALREHLGVNGGGQTRRGKSIIATEETRNSTAFGTMTTPDQVANVVLPSDGVILVSYYGHLRASIAGTAQFALFVGASQADDVLGNAQASLAASSATSYRPMVVAESGCVQGTGASASTGIGAPRITATPAVIAAPAGTYTVSVQFKATSGTVTVRDRRLFVEAKGF